MKLLIVLSALLATAFAGCTTPIPTDDATLQSINAPVPDDYDFADAGQLLGPALKRWAWEVKADNLDAYEVRLDLSAAQGAPMFAGTNVRVQVWDSMGELRVDYMAPADAGQTKDIVFLKAAEDEQLPTGVWTAELEIDAGALDYGFLVDIDY